ncbi:MAG: ABC transporter substrate-binding protein [Dehalococcoidales bacterium]|nr:ABC transporter substrate-binding protein [Dehalococcoidales bacterium]
MNKLFMSIIIVVVLIATIILSGCSTTPATTTAAPTAAAPATTAPAAAAPAVTSGPAKSTVAPAPAQPATSGQAGASSPVSGGILNETFIMGPSATFGFPPTQMSERYYNYVFEPLVREYYDGRLEPLLATDWELASDLSSLTLTLRKGVKFHDGSDFNASVAKWNLDMQIENKKAITRYFSSVEIVDDYTVRINLSKYQNSLLGNLASVTGLITSKEAFEKNGQEWCQTHPIGTGPFKFVSYERDASMKWEKFDGYWQTGRPYLDGIEIFYISDSMTQQAALLKGDVQIMYGAGGSQIYRDLQTKGYNLVYRPADCLSLWPDSINPDSPFAKQEVRQALSYAINRDALVKIAEGGFPTPAFQLPPPFAKAYDSSYAGASYDVEKAKQLLADAGYPDGFKTTLASPFTQRDVMVAIQGYLGKVGIMADIDTINFGQYMEYSQKGWNNMILITPLTHYVNWASGLQMQLSSTAINLKSVMRPSGFDDLLEQALATPEEDISKTRQALRLIEENAVVIPLYSAGTMWCYSPNVHDIGYAELGNAIFRTPDKAWLSK